MNIITCAYCKRRIPDGSHESICSYGGIWFCSQSCKSAYDRENERQQDMLEASRDHNRQLDREADAIREQNRMLSKKADAEYQKAMAIKEQTEFLKQKEAQAQADKITEKKLEEYKTKCQNVCDSEHGRYRLAHRPFQEFDSSISVIQEGDKITVKIERLINNTPNGTGDLIIKISPGGWHRLCDLRDRKKLQTGEEDFIEPKVYHEGSPYCIKIPALKAGENIIDKTYEFTCKEIPLLEDPSEYTHVLVEIGEKLFDDSYSYFAIDRWLKKFDSFKFYKNKYLDEYSDKIIRGKISRAFYDKYYDEERCFNRTNQANIKVEVDDYGLICQRDYKIKDKLLITALSCRFEIYNESENPTGDLCFLFGHLNKHDENDFEIQAQDDPKAFLFPFGKRSGSIYIGCRNKGYTKKNIDAIPYIFVHELREDNPDVPAVIAKINLGEKILYVKKTESPLSDKSKVSSGYLLTDNDGCLFILDDETDSHYYVLDKQTGDNLKCIASDIRRIGYYIENYLLPTELYEIHPEQVVSDKNGGYSLKPGTIKSISEKAESLYKKGLNSNSVKAMEYYIQAAELGNASAQKKLANAYKTGEGVAKNDGLAFIWSKAAAIQGDSAVQNSLAIMYNNGCGTSVNLSEAIKWYKASALQGNQYAQYNLGLMYRDGRGVEKNADEAISWLQKSAAQGFSDAVDRLKELMGSDYDKQAEEYYQKGLSLNNKAEALKWFKTAAGLGHTGAMYLCGKAYETGDGVTKNDSEAYKWYKLGAEHGHAPCQNSLGDFYRDGRVVEKNLHTAFEWFKKSAEQGFVTGQYSLGFAYYKREGVYKDEEKAKEWLKKAAKQGHKASKELLVKLSFSYKARQKTKGFIREKLSPKIRSIVETIGDSIIGTIFKSILLPIMVVIGWYEITRVFKQVVYVFGNNRIYQLSIAAAIVSGLFSIREIYTDKYKKTRRSEKKAKIIFIVFIIVPFVSFICFFVVPRVFGVDLILYMRHLLRNIRYSIRDILYLLKH